MLVSVDFFRKCSILLELQAYLAPIQNDLIFLIDSSKLTCVQAW